jgi:hypothetical protein
MAFAFAVSQAVLAQDKQIATFPDEEQPAAPAIDPTAVDPKVLRRKLGAKDVKWDRKTGILYLTYDFRKGQEKDWEMPGRIGSAKAFKGIRISAGDVLVHKVRFIEGTCAFQYSTSGKGDSGSVVTAGDGISVTTQPRLGRSYLLNGKEKNIGNPQVGPNGMPPVMIKLAISDAKCRLFVNEGEVVTDRTTNTAFCFSLYGGDNGGDFGALAVEGKPDSEWMAEVMAK